MSEKADDRRKDWTPLESAWEVLCDFGEPDSTRRATLREVRQASRECSIADSANTFQQLAFWEQKIKHEFVWRIFDGDFDAIGIDTTDGVSSPEKPIPHVIFDQRVESLSIAWDQNRLSFFSRTIIGIRIAPSERALAGLAVVEPENAAKQQLGPPEPADYPAPAGAKSYEAKREDAILRLYARYDDFEDMTFETKLEKIIALIGQDLAKRGFGRTAVYATIARLKEEGRIASDNVRKQKSSDRTNT